MSGLSLRAMIDLVVSARSRVGTFSGPGSSASTVSGSKRLAGLLAAPRPRGDAFGAVSGEEPMVPHVSVSEA